MTHIGQELALGAIGGQRFFFGLLEGVDEPRNAVGELLQLPGLPSDVRSFLLTDDLTVLSDEMKSRAEMQWIVVLDDLTNGYHNPKEKKAKNP